MFRLFNCEQGSDEWFKSRGRLITASNFNKLITKKLKPSAQWEKVTDSAIAGVLNIDDDIGNFQSQAMLRGHSLEHSALEFVNFTHGYNFKKTGLMIAQAKDEKDLTHDLYYGASPDGIDTENKIGIELKCPLAHTHIGYLIDGVLPEEYVHQVQGAMLVSGYTKWVFVSYHPSLPCMILVIERDDEYIKALSDALDKCGDRMADYFDKFGGTNGQ